MNIFQFLRLAQTLRHYGYLRFDACVADFPEKDCPVVVSAGNSELSLQLRLPGQQLREGSFRVTRMRCWRVTSSVSFFSFFLSFFETSSYASTGLELCSLGVFELMTLPPQLSSGYN